MNYVKKAKIVPLEAKDIIRPQSEQVLTDKSKLYLNKNLFFKLLIVFLVFSSFFLLLANKNLKKQLQIKNEELVVTLEKQDFLEKQIQSLKRSPTEMSTQPPEQQEQAIFNKTYLINKTLKDDPYLGEKDSSLVIMIYTDFNSKLCNKFIQTTLEKLRSDFISSNKIKLILRDAPKEGDFKGEQLSSMTQCAGEQGKYWEALDIISKNKDLDSKQYFKQLAKSVPSLSTNKLQQCVKSRRYINEIAADREDALNLGISGVPSTFIGKKINQQELQGVLIKGAQPYAVLKLEIEKLM